LAESTQVICLLTAEHVLQFSWFSMVFETNQWLAACKRTHMLALDLSVGAACNLLLAALEAARAVTADLSDPAADSRLVVLLTAAPSLPSSGCSVMPVTACAGCFRRACCTLLHLSSNFTTSALFLRMPREYQKHIQSKLSKCQQRPQTHAIGICKVWCPLQFDHNYMSSAHIETN